MVISTYEEGVPYEDFDITISNVVEFDKYIKQFTQAKDKLTKKIMKKEGDVLRG